MRGVDHPVNELGQPLATAALGTCKVAVCPEQGSPRLWLIEEGASCPWLAQVDGLVGVYISSPDGGDNRALIVAGASAGHPGGAPANVTRVRLSLTTSKRVFETMVDASAWLLVLPKDAGAEPALVTLLTADGSEWDTFRVDGLADMLGPHPEANPDGTGWTPYAPLET